MKTVTPFLYLLLLFLFSPLHAADKALFDEMARGQEAIAGLQRHQLVIDGQKIFYLDNENRSAKRTILLIHGFGDSSLTWTQFSRRLRDNDFRIVVPDLLGFGQSDRPAQADYRYPAQSARLFALMQKLGVEEFHVAGNSMGGGIAAQMALDHPSRIQSLILMDAAGIHYRPTDLDRALLDGRNLLVVKAPQDFEALMALVFHNRPPAPRPIVDYLAQRAVQDSALHGRIMRDALFEDINFLMLKMESITSPTLILWGDKDRLLHPDNAKVMHHFIKGSQLVIMPDVGHSPQMEVPYESSEVVVKFVLSLDAGK